MELRREILGDNEDIGLIHYWAYSLLPGIERYEFTS